MSSLFTTFKVWNLEGQLSETACRMVASDHFDDICETFDLYRPSLRMIEKEFDTNKNETVYTFEINHQELPVAA